MGHVVAARPVQPWRAWVLAARMPTLPAAVSPVLVGTAAAAGAGQFHAGYAAAALVVALCMQVGVNYANDAFDFLRGADASDRRGPARATQSGLLSPRQVLRGAYVCFGLAGLIGAYFVALYGWPLLVAGALAIASGILYTGGPWPLGYHGLGEVFVFLFFGVMAVVGSAFVQTGRIEAPALAASVPVGLLAVAILVVNNLRDIETDRRAGKRTLAVRLGGRGTRALYGGCLAVAAAAPALMRAGGLLGTGFWLPWLAAPTMLALIGAVRRAQDGPSFNQVLKRTARLHLTYGLLLAGGLLWG